ncbi:helicase-related protein [Roseibacillus persicicus]|uniref:helicase-related protein n=1 Tax=Roseibacillus persicicus TaxID=454148 RepID=UPI00280C82AA|nr:helicase-related protein [Roseibacillus persicicus]MDQ8192520.1 helicase-related protein [Roseibacillus persicicus]
MSTRFFTNHDQNTLLKKFAGILENNPNLARFDALVGYLRASGYFAIRPHLKNVPKVRILVGIDVDEITEEFHRKGQLLLADAGKALSEFRKGLEADIQQARYSKEVERGILDFVDDVASKKLEIKAHPTRKLHAKIYIFIPEGFNEHKPGHVITGSSNLSASGLGVSKDNPTYEFNALSHDYADVKFAADEFEKLWDEGVSVLPKEVTAVTKNTYLRDDLTPFEIYYKLLIEYWGPAIEYNPNSETDLPEGFMRLAYQMDAVTQGFLLLQRHNGFFLSDVVGLGKTVIAILIAKKFFYHNGFPGHLSEILIVVPPALKPGWEETIDKFKLKGTRIVTNGSLHKIKNAKKYDLVIVDEAHKFRNDTAGAYDELQRICKTRTERRFPDGTYYRKRVILVSATPLNNRPNDIKNLLLLFQDGKDSTLEVANLQRFFANRQKEFQKALKDLTVEEARAEIQKIYEKIRIKVMTEVTIRRTRTDLNEHEDYRKDLEAQGIRFPKVSPPKKILYKLPPKLDQLYDQTLVALSSKLTYNRYRAIGALIPEKKAKYQQAEQISAQLAKIMKILQLKRIDSSFHAFTRSLCRFRDNTERMVTMFEKGTIFIAPNVNITDYLIEGREEELLEYLIKLQQDDPTIEICSPADFDKNFLPGLTEDLNILTQLCEAWEGQHEDPKYDEFLAHLKSEFLSAEINHEASLGGSPKLVIFSESKETTGYLLKRLKKDGFTKVLSVDSHNRKEVMPTVRTNFDANVPMEEKEDDFEIIVSTEVLAEGVNLHRSNVILNYDTPWNSTRLMQRIGRINRIGTTADQVHVYNFFPTAKVDADIELRKKALVKLQAFHSALGEDSQIYSTEEEVDTFGLFDKDLEEERDESLALLMELRQFRQKNPERFREIRNLPLRARCGRKDKTRSGTTISFVRNRRRDGFYYVNPDDTISELSFVEAARIFQANAKEKAVPLPDHHHPQVESAVKHYKDSLQSETVRDQIVDHKIGPAERNALELLKLLINYPQLATKDEIAMLTYAQTSIKKGRYAELQRALNKTFKGQKKAPLKPAALLDHVVSIIDRYYDPGETEDQELENNHATNTDKAKLATLAEKCAEAAAANDQASLAAYEAEIHTIVYRLFDLNKEEIELIESTLAS